MAELRSGNGDALAVLYDRYHRLVYSIALKIVRDAPKPKTLRKTFSSKFIGRRHNSTLVRALVRYGCSTMHTIALSTAGGS